MNTRIKAILMSLVFFTVSAFLLTSCHTVKGAFKGAGKDVSALVGQEEGHHHKSKTKESVKSKKTVSATQSKTTTSNKTTTATTPQTTTSTPQTTTQPKTGY